MATTPDASASPFAALLAGATSARRLPAHAVFEVQGGTSSLAYIGPTSCGEAAVMVRGQKRLLFAVVDALGLDPEAARAALRVSAVLQANADASLADVFNACDRALHE